MRAWLEQTSQCPSSSCCGLLDSSLLHPRRRDGRTCVRITQGAVEGWSLDSARPSSCCGVLDSSASCFIGGAITPAADDHATARPHVSRVRVADSSTPLLLASSAPRSRPQLTTTRRPDPCQPSSRRAPLGQRWTLRAGDESVEGVAEDVRQTPVRALPTWSEHHQRGGREAWRTRDVSRPPSLTSSPVVL